MKEFVKSNLKVIVILLIVIILGVVGLTFAYQMNDIGITLTSGEYSVIYNGTSSLPSSNLTPILDTELTSSSNSSKVLKIEFTVKGASTNPTNRDIIYDVSLTNLDLPKELQSKLLKWRLYKNGTQISEGNFSKDFDLLINNRMVLTEIQQDLPNYINNPDSYIFYIWISETCTGDITTCTEEDDASELMNKTFSGNIRIELSTGSKKELQRPFDRAWVTLVNLGLDSSFKEGTPDFKEMAPRIISHKVVESDILTDSWNYSSSWYYTYADSYDFDTATGLFTLKNLDGSPVTITQNNIDLSEKYIVGLQPSSSANLKAYESIKEIFRVKSKNSAGNLIYQKLTKGGDVYDFSDTGIYAAEDDLGTSYYFRGAVENNYVKFGKNASNQDMYWRIVRINGDGTIRIIYDGTDLYRNDEIHISGSDIARIKYQDSSVSNHSSNAYVGYMHGLVLNETYELEHSNDVNSGVKNYFEGNDTDDGWYKKNIIDTGYDSFVADAIYCNDRSLDTTEGNKNGIGNSSVTYYAAFERLSRNYETNVVPVLTCSRIEDRFTKEQMINNVEGNGKLKYSIALITMDEVVMAGIEGLNVSVGSSYDVSNKNFYLYTGNSYFYLTMTPHKYESYGPNLFAADTKLSYTWTYNDGSSIRPVISLKADALQYSATSNGSMQYPFVVSQ